jgi:hypothetical protein
LASAVSGALFSGLSNLSFKDTTGEFTSSFFCCLHDNFAAQEGLLLFLTVLDFLLASYFVVSKKDINRKNAETKARAV